MKTYITTIEELLGKPKSELHTIFRHASQIAQRGGIASDRAAALTTMQNVRVVLKLRATAVRDLP